MEGAETLGLGCPLRLSEGKGGEGGCLVGRCSSLLPPGGRVGVLV